MSYKFLVLFFVLFSSCNAGIIKSTLGVAKNKAVDKTKEIAVDIYKQRKEIRKENEKNTGKKSIISKTEDKIDSIKNQAQENAKNFIGKENIQNLQKTKIQIKNALIGKPIN